MAEKGGTAIVIGLGRPKGMPMGKSKMDDMGDGEDGSAKAEDEAIQSMMDAAKEDDVPAFKDGLKTFMELCYPQLAHGSDYEEGSASGEE